MNNKPQPAAEDKEKKEEEAIPPPPLLKTLEDMLYNKITQKKREMHKTQNREDTTDTEHGHREIETLQWACLGTESFCQKTTSRRI
jgi:hypothetical protein